MRRFVELDPSGPGVFRVKRVFFSDLPPLNTNIVSAPADKSDAELLDLAIVHERWTTAQALDKAEVKARKAVRIAKNEVLWSGHAFNLGGYAKANREILLRIKNTIHVKLMQDDIWDLDQFVDPVVTATLKALKKEHVSPTAALVRFYTPRYEVEQRFRICWTMMETQRIHPDFINRLNTYYDEAWIPTPWYADVFRKSGLKIPVSVMPLGVNPQIFRPMNYVSLPPCLIVTGPRAGQYEIPRGFLFLNLFQPTFRKGVDVLAGAFECAFGKDPEAALVLATTAHSYSNEEVMRIVRQYIKDARVYILSGQYLEQDLAGFYNACHAYVSATRGEGWNLPMCEAAACGKPVIVPRNTAHIDIVDSSNAFLFEPEGAAPIPGSEKICGWYDRMPFSQFGKKSIDELVGHLRYVKENYASALERARGLMDRMRNEFTWDRAAVRVLDRLTQIWG